MNDPTQALEFMFKHLQEVNAPARVHQQFIGSYQTVHNGFATTKE
jgi:hypothetical protein